MPELNVTLGASNPNTGAIPGNWPLPEDHGETMTRVEEDVGRTLSLRLVGSTAILARP